jgi:hypothetical protein
MMAQSQSPPPPRGLVLDDAVTATTSAGIGQPSLKKVDVGDVQTPAHVVVGADRVHWPGVIGVINSLLANSATPERLHVLALCPSGLEDNFTKYLQCHGLKPSRASDAKLRVAGFDPKRVPPLKVQTKLTNLESPLNFARFYLAELLPGVRKVLYLDADVIVAGDAVALLDGALPAGGAPFTVGCDFFGGDPAPGAAKRLEVAMPAPATPAATSASASAAVTK